MLFNSFSKYSKTQFVRNIGLVLFGSLFSQMFTLVLSPIYSRLYTPEDFGMFASLMAVVGVVATGANLRYCNVVVLAKDHEKAKDAFALSIIVSAVVSSVVGVIFFILPSGVVNRLFSFDLSYLILLYIPVSVFVISSGETVSFWLIRQKKYGVYSGIRILSAFGNASFKIPMGYFGMGILGLLSGQFVGVFVPILWVLLQHWKNLPSLFLNSKLSRYISVAREYSSYPKYMLPQTILSTFSNQIPFLIINVFYSASLAGQYFMAYKVLSLPVKMLIESVKKVLFQKLNELSNLEADARGLLVKSTVFLFFTGIFPVVLWIVFGENIFLFVFGSQWSYAASISIVLAPYLLMLLVESPARVFLEVRSRQKNLFFAETMLLFRPVVFFFGDNYVDFNHAVAIYCVWTIAVAIIVIIFSFSVEK